MAALAADAGVTLPGPVELLDAPDAKSLRQALARMGSRDRRAPARLIVASRPGAPPDEVLLARRLYGTVDILSEDELFVRAEDCRSAGDRALLVATGGWPMLVDAALDGRGEDAQRLLPRLVEQEWLPGLPPAVAGAFVAAAAAPLTPAGAEYFFGDHPPRHPLLRAAPDGTHVASAWVREALRHVRPPSPGLTPAVLEQLTGYYAAGVDPAAGIEAMQRLGQTALAEAIFRRGGGAFFGYRHGYHALQRVLDAFGPDAIARDEDLFIAHLWLLIKSGQTREALIRLEARHPGLPVDLRRLRPSHRPLAMLLRIDISLDVDDSPPVEVVASWARLQPLLTAGDGLARGLLLNTMVIGFLQIDALVEATELAQEALAIYERANCPYLAHFMQLHLCDIELRLGHPAAAADRLRLAGEGLTESGLAFNSEPEIVEAFRSRLAYEEGRFADCSVQTGPLVAALLRGDSWIDLIASMAWPLVLTSFWVDGLRAALACLDQMTLALSRRHGWTRHQRLELLRIRLLQVARRHAEAAMLLEEYDVDPGARRSAHLAVEEGLVRLRHLIVVDPRAEAAVELAATLAARPALELRQKITLSVLQAGLRHRRGERSLVRRHLRIALRSAEATNLVAVLLEDGELLDAILPQFIAEPGPGNARLAVFAQRIQRQLHALPATPMHNRALAGLSRQEHRVLSYVIDGYTNKQIARALGLSASTVKFHLRGLFAKLGVSRRNGLSDAAVRRGIVT